MRVPEVVEPGARDAGPPNDVPHDPAADVVAVAGLAVRLAEDEAVVVPGGAVLVPTLAALRARTAPKAFGDLLAAKSTQLPDDLDRETNASARPGRLRIREPEARAVPDEFLHDAHDACV